MKYPKLLKLLSEYSEFPANDNKDIYFSYISFKKNKSGKCIVYGLDTNLEKLTKSALYQLAIDLNMTKISNDSKTLLLQKIIKLIS